jgi:hypothetical protein
MITIAYLLHQKKSNMVDRRVNRMVSDCWRWSQPGYLQRSIGQKPGCIRIISHPRAFGSASFAITPQIEPCLPCTHSPDSYLFEFPQRFLGPFPHPFERISGQTTNGFTRAGRLQCDQCINSPIAHRRFRIR